VGGSRAGVYGKFSARMLSIFLGKYATVYQAEIFAVLAYALEIQIHTRPEIYVSIGCGCRNISIGTIVPKGVGHFHPAFCGTVFGPWTF